MITDDDGRDSTVPPAPPPAAGGGKVTRWRRETDTAARTSALVQVQVLQMGTII